MWIEHARYYIEWSLVYRGCAECEMSLVRVAFVEREALFYIATIFLFEVRKVVLPSKKESVDSDTVASVVEEWQTETETEKTHLLCHCCIF